MYVCCGYSGTLRLTNSHLDSTKFEYEKKINQQNIKIATLSQEVKDKEGLIANMNSLTEANRNQIHKLEESANLLKNNCEKSDNKLKTCINEINKGNKIIQHLQKELRSTKSKLKSKLNSIQKHEATISGLESRGAGLEAKLADKDRQLVAKDSSIATLKQGLTNSKEQLTECLKEIESNKQVIDWLQKEINSAKISQYSGRPAASMSASLTGRSSVSGAGMPPPPSLGIRPFNSTFGTSSAFNASGLSDKYDFSARRSSGSVVSGAEKSASALRGVLNKAGAGQANTSDKTTNPSSSATASSSASSYNFTPSTVSTAALTGASFDRENTSKLANLNQDSDPTPKVLSVSASVKPSGSAGRYDFSYQPSASMGSSSGLTDYLGKSTGAINNTNLTASVSQNTTAQRSSYFP